MTPAPDPPKPSGEEMSWYTGPAAGVGAAGGAADAASLPARAGVSVASRVTAALDAAAPMSDVVVAAPVRARCGASDPPPCGGGGEKNDGDPNYSIS